MKSRISIHQKAPQNEKPIQSRKKVTHTTDNRIICRRYTHTHIYVNCYKSDKTTPLTIGKIFEQAFYKRGHPGRQEMEFDFIANKANIN